VLRDFDPAYVGSWGRCEPLEDYAATLPGSRVLTDAYGVNRVGIAIQQGHPGWLTYISEFVEEGKTSGLVQGAIDRAGLAQFRVAPSARTNWTTSETTQAPTAAAARRQSSFVIFALKRIIQYLVDSRIEGIVRIAAITAINRNGNTATNVTFVTPLPKSDVSLLSDHVTFPT
jgi:hypothetical protein